MATVEERGDGRTVQLKRVRLSFTDSLLEKKKTSDDPNAKPKHSLNILLEKDSPHYAENHAKIMSAIKAAGMKEWKNEDAYISISEDSPKRVCYRDGLKWKNKEGVVYSGYENAKAFSGSGPSGGQKRPKLLDRHKRPVAEADILDVCYGGVYADVIASFFGTDKGSRGIFASVEAIRSHQEGERMGGGIVVDADDFDDLEEDDAFDSVGDIEL